MFTDTEILLAADRFLILMDRDGFRIRLSDDFLSAQADLVSIGECLMVVRRSLSKGHKVFIEASHGSSDLSSATG